LSALGTLKLKSVINVGDEEVKLIGILLNKANKVKVVVQNNEDSYSFFNLSQGWKIKNENNSIIEEKEYKRLLDEFYKQEGIFVEDENRIEEQNNRIEKEKEKERIEKEKEKEKKRDEKENEKKKKR
jgi:hypothetical protein